MGSIPSMPTTRKFNQMITDDILEIPEDFFEEFTFVVKPSHSMHSPLWVVFASRQGFATQTRIINVASDIITKEDAIAKVKRLIYKGSPHYQAAIIKSVLSCCV